MKDVLVGKLERFRVVFLELEAYHVNSISAVFILSKSANLSENNSCGQ